MFAAENRSIDFCAGWLFKSGRDDTWGRIMGTDDHWTEVTLPDDCMIRTSVSKDAPAGPAMGYFTGGLGVYAREFEIPEAWAGERIVLTFDGVMMNAVITVNGNQCGFHPYGYTAFTCDITDAVYLGQKNRLTVSVNTSMQPNSRWYTGAGIFRRVTLSHLPALHIVDDGVFFHTTAVDYTPDNRPVRAHVLCEAEIANETTKDRLVQLSAVIHREGKPDLWRKTKALIPAGKAAVRLPLTIEEPDLWCAETPALYTASLYLTELGVWASDLLPAQQPMRDTFEESFGIRTIRADAVNGLQINGRCVKLRGGCVHHDNGLLGAASLYDAEFRKLSRLKEAGYNAVRTSHNPPSRVFLRVCDRLGLYVMDEAFDAWGICKQPGDYAVFFEEWQNRDIEAMVRSHRNHPSVILWSTGNEIGERGGLNHGYAWAMKLADEIRRLDPSRPVTHALCSYFSGLDDHAAEVEIKKMASSSVTQNAASAKEDNFWEERSEAFVSMLDVVGYNYSEDRYEKAHTLFPERVLVGTESFPMEIDRIWAKVEAMPWVIGDFTWTAWDYIGEAGIGRSEFMSEEEANRLGPWGLTSHTSAFPWRLANDADFSITGQKTPQGAFRSIVWGSKETALFSVNPARTGRTELVSPWGWPEMEEHYTWRGAEGTEMKAVVYSAAPSVELFLNGKSLGKKTAGAANRFTAEWAFPYTPGDLKAVSRFEDGSTTQKTLQSAGSVRAIRLEPDKTSLQADGQSLCYVAVTAVDDNGLPVPDADLFLTASIDGAAVIAAFGSDNPITDENYTKPECRLFKGRAMIILRSGLLSGETVLTVEGGPLTASARLQVSL